MASIKVIKGYQTVTMQHAAPAKGHAEGPAAKRRPDLCARAFQDRAPALIPSRGKRQQCNTL